MGKKFQIQHGLSNHRLMRIWTSMMTRCYNPNNIGYKKHYGSKGVKVCERWHKFINFYEDVIPSYKDGLTIDRFPNKKGNYEPSNFRWVTPKEQTRNVSCNIIIEYKGEKMCIGELAEKVNIPYGFMYRRIVQKGWSIERAVSESIDPNLIECNGERHTITEWAKKIDLSVSTLAYRIKVWGIEKALTTPKTKVKKNV